MTDQEILDLARQCSEQNIALGTTGELREAINRGTLLFARALLSKAIPEGYVVVPKEPTDEMLRESGFRLSYAHEVWEHMIAAAPSVEGEGA